MRANANVHNERPPAQTIVQRIAVDSDHEFLEDEDAAKLMQPVQPLHDRHSASFGRRYGEELNGKVGT